MNPEIHPSPSVEPTTTTSTPTVVINEEVTVQEKSTPTTKHSPPLATLAFWRSPATVNTATIHRLLNYKPRVSSSVPLDHVNSVGVPPVAFTDRDRVQNLSPLWPFWSQSADEINGEGYQNLFKSIGGGGDGANYLAHKDVTIDKEVKLRAVLFVVDGVDDANCIKLCSGQNPRVITSKGLLPNYLNFIKGAVDSAESSNVYSPMAEANDAEPSAPKLSKNIRLVRPFRAALVNISLNILEEMDKEVFYQFYSKYSRNLKQGIVEDSDNFDRLFKLLRYHTSVSGDDRVPLGDYLFRMNRSQKHIYYEIGESLDTVRDSKHVERMMKKGLEVVFMTEDASLEMSVVRKLSESKALGGRAMILVSHHTDNDSELSEEPLEEDSRPSKSEIRHSIDGDISTTDGHQEKSLIRKQCRKVGKAKPSVSNGTQVKKTRKMAKKIVDFEGEKLSLWKFLRLPEDIRDVVESIQNSFFDGDTGHLCFKVKWKYYPANHKDKYNNEFLSNIHNFTGGVEAVRAYVDKIKYRKTTSRFCTHKIVSECEAALQMVENEFSSASTSPAQKSSSDDESCTDVANPKYNAAVDSIDSVGNESCAEAVNEDGERCTEEGDESHEAADLTACYEGNAPVPAEKIFQNNTDSVSDYYYSESESEYEEVNSEESQLSSDESSNKVGTKRKRSVGTDTLDPFPGDKRFKNKAAQTDRPVIITKRVYETPEGKLSAVQPPTQNAIKYELTERQLTVKK